MHTESLLDNIYYNICLHRYHHYQQQFECVLQTTLQPTVASSLLEFLRHLSAPFLQPCPTVVRLPHPNNTNLPSHNIKTLPYRSDSVLKAP
jgi:hypothetical protein